MTRLLHLSDLHFGALDDGAAAALLALLPALSPDATVISGDLTQRARRGQFAAARAYAARLPQPVLAVPGNHDMPLYNLVRRLSRPLGGYVRAFGPDVEPALDLPGVVVQGVNTADPLVWKAGRLRAASVARLTARFAAAPAGVWRVAVLHHAPVPAADGTPADMADPAGALSALARAGAQVVLSGHTHMPHSGPAPGQPGMLMLQVGTAISTRRKTPWNDFSLIAFDAGGVTLHPHAALPGQPFQPGPEMRWTLGAEGWSMVNKA